MKYLYLFLVLFVLTNTANSQPFTEQGNEWVQNAPFLSNGYFPIVYFVAGDTMIADKSYAKVFFSEQEGGLADTAYYAAIRQSNDSVFIVDSDAAANEERLIYVWNSYEVDTMEITSYPTLILETIDTIMFLNGEQHRQFNYTLYRELSSGELDTVYNYKTVIEDVGFITNGSVFFRDQATTPEYSFPDALRCFSRNGERLWLNPLFNVDCESIIVGTQILREEIPFKLFPNPAQDIVYVEWQENTGTAVALNVYSSTGILVYSQQLDQSTSRFEIPTRGWVKGLYFIQFISEKGLQFSSSLVKK